MRSEPRTRWSGRLAAWLPARRRDANIDALDGLRAVAAVLVVVVHAFGALWYLGHGSTRGTLHAIDGFWGLGASGVLLFFVLSAFLLFQPYAERLFTDDLPKVDVRRYFVRRASRILPAYWVSLVLVTALGFAHWNHPNHGWDLALHATLVHNWNTLTQGSINGVYWTIAVESQFYLVLPVLGAGALALRRAGRHRTLIAVAGLLCLGTFAKFVLARALVTAVPRYSDHVELFNLVYFFSVFMDGIVASVVFTAFRAGRLPWPDEAVKRWSRRAAYAGVAALVVHAVLTSAAVNLELFNHYPFHVVMGAAYTAILLGVLIGVPAWNRALARPTIRLVGIVSFSLYLWHLPLLEHVILPVVTRAGSPFVAIPALILLSTLVLLPASMISYRLFERPFLDIGSRRASVSSET